MTTLYDIDKMKAALKQAKADLVKYGQHDIRCDVVIQMSLIEHPRLSVKEKPFFTCTCGLDEQIAKLQAVIDET